MGENSALASLAQGAERRPESFFPHLAPTHEKEESRPLAWGVGELIDPLVDLLARAERPRSGWGVPIIWDIPGPQVGVRGGHVPLKRGGRKREKPAACLGGAS